MALSLGKLLVVAILGSGLSVAFAKDSQAAPWSFAEKEAVLEKFSVLEKELDELSSIKLQLKEAREATELLRQELQSRSLTEAVDYSGPLNHMWLILCGTLVMLMQAGFALLEAGACRAKNAQNLLLKNLSDICIGTLCWWSFGWMIAYGTAEEPSTNFAGNKQYFAHDFMEVSSDGVHTPSDLMVGWFFQWAFCGAASTIVSGGVAERIMFPGYVVYTICMTTFIYPVVVYWTWSGSGWLYGGEDAVTDVGYYDFAGSGIVHMTGGVGALVGAIVLGPRQGRFEQDDEDFAPHNIPLVVLGTFILWFGWYGFNCGSTLGMADTATGQLAALVAMNTTVAAATGGLTVFLLRLAMLRRYDVGGMCNGILAGLVSITAPCGNVETYSAFLIAILGGCIYQGSSSALKLLKVDDPLDAWSVHGACGCWGALAAVIFDWGKGLDFFNGWSGFDCTRDSDGNCLSGAWTSALGAQVVGLICIILWVTFWSLLIMVPMRLAGVLRVPDEVQQAGMDVVKHSPTKAYFNEGESPAHRTPSGNLVQVVPKQP
eukprot:CAMPEP_0178406246 /NCGR_PEP_ID=MMETSP0689_2-20121128/18814_1 /TAXON_ID=160604 /ORGANISM="Amphidinium massartii, Strain CS-259" /LENGTH=544 /DNA_ID=CAMNT_0020027283 /DNA_START=67 /DNA_END=1701 /DNA_ORIENTATION=+